VTRQSSLVVAAGVLALGGLLGTRQWSPTSESSPALDEMERSRLRRHFATVEQELRDHPLFGLSSAQRAARDRNLQTLREYSERGRFPHNHDFPAKMVPYFVDAHGTLCAVAYLVARSGREDLVRAVVARSNNARVFELAEDPVLGPGIKAWLDTAGFTVAEAARIQPAYCGQFPNPSYCSPKPDSITTEYAAASAVTLGSSLLSGVLNATHAARWHAILGVASGAVGVALGLTQVNDSGAPLALGLVDAGVGLASGALGIYRLEHPSAPRNLSSRVSVSLVPFAGRRPRRVLGLSISF
jgi:hypothetical protein